MTSTPYFAYVRRSWKEEHDADVSDQTQEADCRSVLPKGASVELFADSGGYNSGRTGNRAGLQSMLARIEQGNVAGVVVYNLQRLGRNAELLGSLHRQMEAKGIPLILANMPNTRFDNAAGRFLLGILAQVAQFESDTLSETMTKQARRTFEAGAPRGHDRYGYRSMRDADGRIANPRRWEVVPEEAKVVRRVWRELAHRTYAEIAACLNGDGIPSRSGKRWTRDAVRDIARAGRTYLGFVVTKRGLEERVGLHEAIITEDMYRDGILGIQSHTRAGRKPKPYRAYPLAGLLRCARCDALMWGMARVQRRTSEIRYYRCPTPQCGVRLVRADRAEDQIVAAIRAAALPNKVIDRAREELRRRLDVPRESMVETQRKRLLTRKERIAERFEWSDIDRDEYRRKIADVDRALATLPSSDVLVAFDRNREVLSTWAANVDAASPKSLASLCRLLLDRAVARDAELVPEETVWTRPMAAFLAPVSGSEVVNGAPKGIRTPDLHLERVAS